MNGKWIAMVVLAATMTAALPVFAEESIGWSLTGGPVWERRTGPGVSLALGGNSCTGDFCDSTLDVNLFGSFAGTFGFMYRIIPNLVVFGDLHTAYINTDMDDGMRDNKGFLFQMIVGSEFHVPFTGWLDAYLGLGIGYALLRAKAFNEALDWDQVLSLRGVDIELKVGADVYPFSRIPNLALGVLFRIGFTAWPTACIQEDNDARTCFDPDDRSEPADGWYDVNQTPFLVFIGLTAKYIFSSAAKTTTAATTSNP